MGCLIAFLFMWKPKRIWTLDGEAAPAAKAAAAPTPAGQVAKAWTPWVILSVMVGLWGTPAIKAALDRLSMPKLPVHGLHMLVQRMPPVVQKPTPEPAVFVLNWLSATGTGILLAAVLSGIIAGLGFGKLIKLYGRTLVKVRFSLLTIAAMLAVGFLTRYSGLDATMGLAFARTGALYPFFGTMLGWLGVALTGSDTSSNVLFGSLQKITAQQIGVQPEPDGLRQQRGRGDGQDDRRPEHRGGLHRHPVVWPRRRHPALRVLPLHRPGGAGRLRGVPHGLRLPIRESRRPVEL